MHLPPLLLLQREEASLVVHLASPVLLHAALEHDRPQLVQRVRAVPRLVRPAAMGGRASLLARQPRVAIVRVDGALLRVGVDPATAGLARAFAEWGNVRAPEGANSRSKRRQARRRGRALVLAGWACGQRFSALVQSADFAGAINGRARSRLTNRMRLGSVARESMTSRCPESQH